MRNGFVVQINEPTIYSLHKEYIGICARRSWPLENTSIQDDLENLWTIEYLNSLNNGNGHTLDAIYDKNTLEEYIKLCKSKGLNLRILYVEISQIGDEFKKNVDLYKVFNDYVDMGYDLIYPESSDFYYSALNDERDIINEAGYLQKLNSFGLFNSLSNLEGYISWRNNNLNPLDVEPLDDFVKAHIILCKDFSISK